VSAGQQAFKPLHRFEERDAPTIIEPTDAIIRISATCVCGSDLWPYRGIEPITAQAVLLGEASTVKINIRIEERSIPATLNDSKAAEDFASLLPLSMTLEDYSSTEKISDLPKRLSMEGAPPGYDPSIGDISYYAPWGNLALFYRDAGYAKGLVKLGNIDSGVEALRRSGSLRVSIELREK
jgi:hypothetical protein